MKEEEEEENGEEEDHGSEDEDNPSQQALRPELIQSLLSLVLPHDQPLRLRPNSTFFEKKTKQNQKDEE